MSRGHMFLLMGGFVAAIVAAYFAFLAANPGMVARVLMHRGYEQRGWTEERLSKRVRVLSLIGAVLAVAAILLAIVKFVG
jgi:hypothetical protein